MNNLEMAWIDVIRPASVMIDVEIILVFASNTEVLNVEDLLEDIDMSFELIPVPKEVNPNCGLAISFKQKDKLEIMTALSDAGYKATAAYLRRGDEFLSL